MDGVAVAAGAYLALVEGRLQSSHDEAAWAAAAVLRDLAQGAAELTVLTAAEAGLSDAIDALADGAGPAVRTVEGGGSGVPAVRVRHAGSRAADGRDHRDRARSTANLADPGGRSNCGGAADRQLRRRTFTTTSTLTPPSSTGELQYASRRAPPRRRRAPGSRFLEHSQERADDAAERPCCLVG